MEWKDRVDPLKVGFLNSEGIKKEGRIPLPPRFLHHVHSCYIFRRLLIRLIRMLCVIKLEQSKQENVSVQLLLIRIKAFNFVYYIAVKKKRTRCLFASCFAVTLSYALRRTYCCTG